MPFLVHRAGRATGFTDSNDEYLTREHEAIVARFEFGDGRIRWWVTVGVMGTEHATDAGGPVTEATVPLVYLEGDLDITGRQVRQVAAALLNAADLCDAATR